MNSPKIFLIEDDKTMVNLLGTLLRLEGFEISKLSEEKTLDQMLEAVQQVMPDLILLDVHLHQHDGFDLLQRIRQDKKLKNASVIMCSGMDYSKRCQDEGADGFILKPYMPEDLIAKIRQILDE
jgi:DNA-binding response OmpR family regulator